MLRFCFMVIIKYTDSDLCALMYVHVYDCVCLNILQPGARGV